MAKTRYPPWQGPYGFRPILHFCAARASLAEAVRPFDQDPSARGLCQSTLPLQGLTGRGGLLPWLGPSAVEASVAAPLGAVLAVAPAACGRAALPAATLLRLLLLEGAAAPRRRSPTASSFGAVTAARRPAPVPMPLLGPCMQQQHLYLHP